MGALLDDVRKSSGDDVMVSITAVADVITAPVESNINAAKGRKTHEVLRDALAAGLVGTGIRRVLDPRFLSHKVASCDVS